LARVELVGNADESSEEIAGVRSVTTTNRSQNSSYTSEANVDGNGLSTRINDVSLAPANSHEEGKVDTMAKLKERLRLAEMNCSRLEELYQKYRLRWLEENYRVRVLEEYAPNGVSTCSPHQIPWDAPSPTQSTSDA
jgi:hypothetical protein